MDEEYIRKRITELRLYKNISEYKMSIELGHSKGYIQSISSGRALPSMTEFFAICDYFNITPTEFFSDDNGDILAQKELQNEISVMKNDDLQLLTDLAHRLNKK